MKGVTSAGRGSMTAPTNWMTLGWLQTRRIMAASCCSSDTAASSADSKSSSPVAVTLSSFTATSVPRHVARRTMP